MKIAIIGTGNLGLSIAKGLLISDKITSLFLTKNKTSTIKDYNEIDNVFVTNDNIKAVTESDIIIVSVQPSDAVNIFKSIKDKIKENHIIISTITGLKIFEIEKIIGADKKIIRSMPNTAISVRKSLTCICSNNTGSHFLDLCISIFNSIGKTIIIEESKMQSATVMCASGIAFWMRIIRAMAQGGIELGFEAKDSLEMSYRTAEGAINLLELNKTHPEEEIDKVTTPSGCTIKGIIEMENKGLSSAIIHGLISSYDKINNIK
tara:strand:+ start:1645 stop:2433 length:789 start_codon:yes stop_codon:yes gene_type:complete